MQSLAHGEVLPQPLLQFESSLHRPPRVLLLRHWHTKQRQQAVFAQGLDRTLIPLYTVLRQHAERLHQPPQGVKPQPVS
jgi:hypothetical protein